MPDELMLLNVGSWKRRWWEEEGLVEMLKPETKRWQLGLLLHSCPKKAMEAQSKRREIEVEQEQAGRGENGTTGAGDGSWVQQVEAVLDTDVAVVLGTASGSPAVPVSALQLAKLTCSVCDAGHFTNEWRWYYCPTHGSR